MTMILTVSVFLLIVFIRFGIYFSSEKQELERYRVFYQLGMEKKTILKHFINNGFTESFMGVISAGIAFSCRTGYDFVNAHLACFCGEAIPNKIKFNERLDVKYFTESNI